ncbi:hypothetical protein KC19_9G046000 [Ceratodon purpureus]|uniref:Uncharacterized protein n=1 Tax=Ceratodon purpureus TaxID=3225 RepID=A0A8T0GST4_CERPU|nr:hypothetical protein KC19_9G046000 [Ceratodon purpureus]
MMMMMMSAARGGKDGDKAPRAARARPLKIVPRAERLQARFSLSLPLPLSLSPQLRAPSLCKSLRFELPGYGDWALPSAATPRAAPQNRRSPPPLRPASSHSPPIVVPSSPPRLPPQRFRLGSLSGSFQLVVMLPGSWRRMPVSGGIRQKGCTPKPVFDSKIVPWRMFVRVI